MKKRGLILFWVVVLVGICSITAFAADQLLRESWYTFETQGKIVGFAGDQTWKTAEGYRYVTDMTMMMEMLQSQPITVTEHMEEIIRFDYQPISFRSFSTTNTSQMIVTGEFSADLVKITVIADGGKAYESTWQTTEPVYVTNSLVQMAVDEGIKVGMEKSLLTWNNNKKQPELETLRVEKQVDYTYNGKTIPTFEVVIDSNDGVTRMLIDESGENYWGEIRSAGQTFVMRKTERDQIPQLQAMEADALIVPGNIQVSRPFSSITSELTVSWRDVPYEEFRWDDNRQKVTDHLVDGNEHQVTVQVARDGRDFTGKVQVPVQNPELAKYLADEQYVMPSLPAVQEWAHQIVGEETDGWVVTQKLTEWVFNYIKPTLIPETLTAEQILQKKVGKCVEYAVLFASVARSAGLPTRIALGERYQDNIWVGHLWNEVWMDGEWIAVDASHNQTAPDALLLKFVDSDTVMGTQIVRRGLTGKLAITIDDVKLAEGSGGETLTTGIEGQTYTNADYSCQITAPGGWMLVESEDQGVPMIVMLPDTQSSVTAIMLMFTVPAGTQPEMIMDQRLPALQGMLPGFELVGQEKTTVFDKPAVSAAWTMTQGIKFQQQNIVMIAGDLGYLFVFSTPADRWEEYQSIFGEILGGFVVK